MAGTSRVRFFSHSPAKRASWRSRYPSGRPNPSNPAARQSTAWRAASASIIASAVSRSTARQPGRRLGLHDHAVEPCHHVEGRADHGRVVAHGQHVGDGHPPGERTLHARLAQHVVRARRQRAARRPPQHEPRVAARDGEGHVGVPLADRLDAGLTRPQPVRVEELEQRVEHEQRLPRAGAHRIE